LAFADLGGDNFGQQLAVDRPTIPAMTTENVQGSIGKIGPESL
jgi:hypothetical protein